MFSPRECLTALRAEAAIWCRGKNWIVRLPLFFFFLYIFIRHLFTPDYLSVLQSLNLGIHECGHFLFLFFGQFLCVLGGTVTELAAPFAGMWNFYRQKDFFALALCFGWLSTALFDVARYAGDARAMVIPLVSPFGGGDDGIKHDWNFLLGQTGLLESDQAVAFFFRSLAVISMLVALGGGCWLLWNMMLGDEETAT
jgi:hypothetical protein